MNTITLEKYSIYQEGDIIIIKAPTGSNTKQLSDDELGSLVSTATFLLKRVKE